MASLTVLAFLFVAVYLPISADKCPDGWVESFVDTDKCYLVATQREIWFNAEIYCRNAYPGAHLASICSAFENANINAIVVDAHSVDGHVWIGLNDIENPGTFKWADGSSCQYTKWLPGQPNTDSANQCVASYAKNNGWSLDSCAIDNYFVCKLSKSSETTSSAVISTSSTVTPSSSSSIASSTSSTFMPSSSSSIASSTSSTFMPSSSSTSGYEPTDCYDLFNTYGVRRSGIYSIQPPGFDAFPVYCDMETDGGGWTVFQRRTVDNLVFGTRTWNEYKTGFNNGLEKSLWLGNDNIHALSTKDSNVELRIDLWGDVNERHDRYWWFGKFASFSMDSAEHLYTFHISNSPLAGNDSIINDPQGIYYNNGVYFSTYDAWHAGVPIQGCSKNLGGWWIYACTYVDVNGDTFDWTTRYYTILLTRSTFMLRKLVG